MLRCSISNSTPMHPVVGIPTGLVYEKSLIEKSIDENGICPISKIALRKSDLIPLKANEPHVNPPRSLEGASIPALLASFQNEWDATALEMFRLRQTLDKTRKELAQALYQHDAACRVIARLVKERDEARNALATVAAAPMDGTQTGDLNNNHVADDKSLRITPLSEGEKTKINEVASTLMGSRSAKRKSMTGVSETFSWKPHQLSKDEGGSLCLDLDDNADAAAIGSRSGLVKVIVRSSGKQEREHQLGNSEISRVKFVHDNNRTVLALASDKTVHVLSRQGETKMVLGSVPTDCCEQATHDFGFVTERAGKWTMFRFGTGEAAAVGQDSANPGQLMSVDVHPDGKVFATGGAANGSVGIWNVLTGQLEAHLSPGDANLGHASFLDFGENGVSLAAGFSATGVVKVWDMRKADSPLLTFQPAAKANLCSVSFDPSGQTLLSAYEDGSLIVRNVVRTGAWPVSFQSAGGNGMVAASPGVGSCLVLGKDGILVEWR